MLYILKKRNAPLGTQEKREAPRSIYIGSPTESPKRKHPKKHPAINNPRETPSKKYKKAPKTAPSKTKHPASLMNFRGKGKIIFKPNPPLPTLTLHWRYGAVQILWLPHPLSLPLPGREQVQHLVVIPSPSHPQLQDRVNLVYQSNVYQDKTQKTKTESNTRLQLLLVQTLCHFEILRENFELDLTLKLF
jgi:hypothetical protein